MEIPNDTKERIAELQKLEQNLQAFSSQSQRFQTQLFEVENAKNELGKLKDTEKAYKMVGNIMILSEKNELSKDMDSKQEIFSLRIKNIEKQEEKIKEKMNNLQEDIMKKLNKKEEK